MMPDLSDIVDLLFGLVERALIVAQQAESWAAMAFEKAPALALGTALMLALLPLTAVGLAMRRARISGSSRAFDSRGGLRDKQSVTRGTSDAARWPADAWIELDGGKTYWVGRRMVRIGRGDDNEIRLRTGTVHRHHAVIHHTEDAEFMIKDLSSVEGNGVVVNGRRVGEARLRHGDTLVLGEAVLKFHLQPA